MFYKNRWKKKTEGRLATWENKDNNNTTQKEINKTLKNRDKTKMHSNYKILDTAFVHVAHLSKCLLSTRTP